VSRSVLFDHVKPTIVHNPLVALLTGHARALSSRHPPQADELTSIVIELEYIVRILQGLCLMSERSKSAVGEQHVLEVSVGVEFWPCVSSSVDHH